MAAVHVGFLNTVEKTAPLKLEYSVAFEKNRSVDPKFVCLFVFKLEVGG